ncbi:hypothetical protein BJH92_10125 [Paenibacillus polymyxa]|nr:hypothetical protein [Paenibacillus polymyxa]KAE8560228.1 hypothetical protein BJH92_10125 [Paenibacillus polymyxa]MCJ1223323.1 hypothetical protein [Paenibacillus polymyxa]
MPVDMIDEKLDFALAGLLGWVNVWDGVRLIWVDGATKEFRRKVTDWQPSSDPATSLEVQAAAVAKDAELYITHMNHVLWEVCINLQYKHAAQIANATPRQRAEAAYMTLSKQD